MTNSDKELMRHIEDFKIYSLGAIAQRDGGTYTQVEYKAISDRYAKRLYRFIKANYVPNLNKRKEKRVNLTIKIPVKNCEYLKEQSHYNWNVYRLPIYFDGRNILVMQADDDRTEYMFLVTEQMMMENNWSDKLHMWARDSERDDQSVFEFEQRYFGETPS